MRHRLFIALVSVASLCAASAAAQEVTPQILLGSGHMGRYEWAVEVEAPEDENELRQGAICLSVIMLEPTSAHTAEGNEVAQCGVLEPQTPMIEIYDGGARRKPRRVIGMLIGGEARTLRLKLAGQPVRYVRLRTIDKKSLEPITKTRVTYFVHGYAQAVCIQHAVAFDATGAPVARIGRQC